MPSPARGWGFNAEDGWGCMGVARSDLDFARYTGVIPATVGSFVNLLRL